MHWSFIKQPVEITVELVQGTLWAKVKLARRIFFVVFTGYASIDGAINTTEKLCKSANLFGDYVCSSFIKEAKAKPEQVERVERRLKTPGKLRRVLKQMERLDMNATRMSKDELQSELRKTKLEFENAMKDLDEADQQALKNLEFRRLPPYRNWPTRDDIMEPARLALPRLEDRRSKRLLIGKEGIPTAKPRRRFEYRKTFTVSRSGDVR